MKVYIEWRAMAICTQKSITSFATLKEPVFHEACDRGASRFIWIVSHYDIFAKNLKILHSDCTCTRVFYSCAECLDNRKPEIYDKI